MITVAVARLKRRVAPHCNIRGCVLEEALRSCLRNMSNAQVRRVREWLDSIQVPFDPGVMSHCVANLRYFERLREFMPAWPWPFNW
jgi:hypothetical protein